MKSVSATMMPVLLVAAMVSGGLAVEQHRRAKGSPKHMTPFAMGYVAQEAIKKYEALRDSAPLSHSMVQTQSDQVRQFKQIKDELGVDEGAAKQASSEDDAVVGLQKRAIEESINGDAVEDLNPANKMGPDEGGDKEVAEELREMASPGEVPAVADQGAEEIKEEGTKAENKVLQSDKLLTLAQTNLEEATREAKSVINRLMTSAPLSQWMTERESQPVKALRDLLEESAQKFPSFKATEEFPSAKKISEATEELKKASLILGAAVRGAPLAAKAEEAGGQAIDAVKSGFSWLTEKAKAKAKEFSEKKEVALTDEADTVSE